MYVTIALISFLMAGINGHFITEKLKLHSTGEFPCNYKVLADRIVAVQWYRSSRSDAFIQDGDAVAFWNEERTGASGGFHMKEDFSLIIQNVSLTNEGLYRCIVTPSGTATDYVYDVSAVVYATPLTSPLLEYTRNASGFLVTCLVDHVFPMTPPKLASSGGREAEGPSPVVNKDGTYNMTANYFIPCSEGDLTIYCSYSNLNYESTSSLRFALLHKGCPEESDDLATNGSCKNQNKRNTSPGLWMGWTTLHLEIFVLIVIAHGVKTGRIHYRSADMEIPVDHEREFNQDDDAQGNEKKRNNLTSLAFWARPYYLAFIVTVELIIIFLAIVCLAIGHSLANEHL